VRSWLVIPAMGVACGGAAVAAGGSPLVALTGMALAAVIRVLAGDSPAALSGAVVAPILAVASFADAGGEPVWAALALAAAGWTVVELARTPGAAAPAGDPPDHRPDAAPGGALGSPVVVVAPAVIAAVLDPSYVALVAIAGASLVTRRWRRPRWAAAVPVAGALAIALAVVAGTSWPALGARWFGAAAHPVAAGGLAGFAGRVGAALGPLTAVAALAGLASLARARYAEAAVASAVVGAALVDVRAGALGPASIGLAALLAGLAIGRLAAMIRIPSGQAIAGATIGLIVAAPPAWSAFEHGPPPAHTGQASR
jgi:hypothetical protein